MNPDKRINNYFSHLYSKYLGKERGADSYKSGSKATVKKSISCTPMELQTNNKIAPDVGAQFVRRQSIGDDYNPFASRNERSLTSKPQAPPRVHNEFLPSRYANDTAPLYCVPRNPFSIGNDQLHNHILRSSEAANSHFDQIHNNRYLAAPQSNCPVYPRHSQGHCFHVIHRRQSAMRSSQKSSRRFYRGSYIEGDVSGCESDQPNDRHSSEMSEDVDSLSDLDVFKGSPKFSGNRFPLINHNDTEYSSIEKNYTPFQPQPVSNSVTWISQGHNQVGLMNSMPTGIGTTGRRNPLSRGGASTIGKSRLKPEGETLLLISDSEVKRCPLPQHLESVETLKELFVKAFPNRLNPDYLNNPERSIYILDKKTNLFYELEDIQEVVDSSVLKIHSRSSGTEVQSENHVPLRTSDLEYESESSIKTLRPNSPTTNVATKPGRRKLSQVEQIQCEEQQKSQYFSDSELDVGKFIKSMNSRSSFNNKIHKQGMRNKPVSQGGSPQHTCRSLSRPTTPRELDTHPYPPAANQNNNILSYQTAHIDHHNNQVNHNSASHQTHPIISPLLPNSEGELTCTCPPELHQAILDQQQLGSLGRQGALPLSTDPNNGIQFIPQNQCHQPMKVLPPLYCKVPDDNMEAQARIVFMEAQLAHLTAWIQALQSQACVDPNNPLLMVKSTQATNHTPSNSSLDSAYSARSTTSSEASGHSTHTLPTRPSPALLIGLRDAKSTVTSLKREVSTLKRTHQTKFAAFKDEMNEMFLSIKKMVSKVPGANEAPIRAQRTRLDDILCEFQQEGEKTENRLRDLEVAIEDLRVDVLHRKCRVRIPEVEALALHLSGVSKTLADLKTQFPELQDQIKSVLQAEMEIVIRDETFLKSEPTKLDSALKRCKKLTGTLFTLKRLGSVQENADAEQVVHIKTVREPDQNVRKGVLMSIEAIVPNHEDRLKCIQKADELRERKKRMLVNQESLKFAKSLQLAAKHLKTPTTRSEECRVSSSTSWDDVAVHDTGASDSSPEESTSAKDVHDGNFEEVVDEIICDANNLMTSSLELKEKCFSNGGDEHSPGSSSDTNLPSSRNSSSLRSSGTGTILKHSNNPPPLKQSSKGSKVVFSRTVVVEDGSEMIRLNSSAEDESDVESCSKQNTYEDAFKVPPAPPPRKGSHISQGHTNELLIQQNGSVQKSVTTEHDGVEMRNKVPSTVVRRQISDAQTIPYNRSHSLSLSQSTTTVEVHQRPQVGSTYIGQQGRTEESGENDIWQRQNTHNTRASVKTQMIYSSGNSLVHHSSANYPDFQNRLTKPAEFRNPNKKK